MKLYLVRHAEAEAGGNDLLRSLTERGKEQARISGQVLRLLVQEETPKIWSSPALRARQTAQLIGEAFPSPLGVEEHDSLGLPPDFQALRKELAELGMKEQTLILVTHMPFIGECSTYWSTGHAHPGLDVPKSGIVFLKGHKLLRGSMTLKAFLPREVQQLLVSACS